MTKCKTITLPKNSPLLDSNEIKLPLTQTSPLTGQYFMDKKYDHDSLRGFDKKYKIVFDGDEAELLAMSKLKYKKMVKGLYQ